MEEELQSSSQTKIFLLRNSGKYYIGEITELDEEPAFFAENVYELCEGYTWGDDQEQAESRVPDEGMMVLSKSEQFTLPPTNKDEHIKESWECEYITLRPFPRYTPQRHVFLTSDQIMTILDPEPKVLDLYNRQSG